MASQPHLLLVPGPGLGHINGFMLLAKSLLSAGFSISCACFARAYHTQQHRIRALDPAIRLEVLDDGLSPDSKSYLGFFTATPTMSDSFVQLLERLSFVDEQPVCCIVADPFMAWTQDVADRFRIPRVDYFTATADAYSLIVALPELVSKGYIPHKGAAVDDLESEIPTLPGLSHLPVKEIPPEILFGDVSDPFLQTLITAGSLAGKAERVLIHSLYELESSAFERLRESQQIKAYAIGPLIQHAFDSTDEGGDKQECVSWLDTQADSSVIYVSFGSNAPMSEDELVELACGLEASEQPFLWVIRFDAVKGDRLSKDVLPEGFELRTKGRGRIVSWAPQVAVLAHPAVGGFLTHCGWNSTLESMWMGVPMLGWPRRAEQMSNSRRIAEEWGVGMELGRTNTGGVERAEVERGVKALMIGKEGQQVRSKVQELKKNMRKTVESGGHSHTNLLNFAHDMKAYSSKLPTTSHPLPPSPS